MHKALSIFLGFLLMVPACAAASAIEKACDPTPAGRTLSFLNDVNLKIDVAEDAADPGFALNEDLIGEDPVNVPSENPEIEIEPKADLAAVSIKTTGAVTPYVEAGIATTEDVEEAPGLTALEAAQEAERQSYQLGAGFGCELSKTARLDLGYRYSKDNLSLLPGTGTGNATAEPAADDHHISIGLQVDF